MRNFIQSTVNTSSVTDPYSASTYPLWDKVANSTALSVIRTQCYFGDIGSPSPGGEGTINDWGKAYDLDAYGTLTTDATPGTLTVGVRLRQGTTDANNTYVTLASATFTPDASLSGAGFRFQGVLLPEPQYPKSVTSEWLFTGCFEWTTSTGARKCADLISAATGQGAFQALTVPAVNVTAQMIVQWQSALSDNIIQFAPGSGWFQRS